MPRPGRSQLLARALLLTSLAACGGSVRTVRTDATGGTLALQGNRDSAMEDAERAMAAHCGAGRYHVTSEGAEPLAGEPTGDDHDGPAEAPGPAATTTASTAGTEWRIHYQCGPTAAPAVAPTGATTAPPPPLPPPPPPAPGY